MEGPHGVVPWRGLDQRASQSNGARRVQGSRRCAQTGPEGLLQRVADARDEHITVQRLATELRRIDHQRGIIGLLALREVKERELARDHLLVLEFWHEGCDGFPLQCAAGRDARGSVSVRA
jgi:hypothetical protein